MIDRRQVLVATGAIALTSCTSAFPTHTPMDFSDLQARLGPGGRLGVAALDTSSRQRISFQSAQRFAFCSTFKLFLAAAILTQVEMGRLSLNDMVRFSQKDMLTHAPVTEANLAGGELSIADLCAAIVEVSDNPAANLLLSKIGGPAGMTRFFRTLGDSESRLDRWETMLNQNLPGDVRDTTTPQAALGSMEAVLLGKLLAPSNRARLAGWMVNSNTGLDRLRAGLPAEWRSGDKTGTGAKGANNDLAIAWPGERAPILIASFTSEGSAPNAVRNTVHVEVARRIAAYFA